MNAPSVEPRDDGVVLDEAAARDRPLHGGRASRVSANSGFTCWLL